MITFTEAAERAKQREEAFRELTQLNADQSHEIERLNRTIAFLEKQNIKLSKRLLEVLKDG